MLYYLSMFEKCTPENIKDIYVEVGYVDHLEIRSNGHSISTGMPFTTILSADDGDFLTWVSMERLESYCQTIKNQFSAESSVLKINHLISEINQSYRSFASLFSNVSIDPENVTPFKPSSRKRRHWEKDPSPTFSYG